LEAWTRRNLGDLVSNIKGSKAAGLRPTHFTLGVKNSPAAEEGRNSRLLTGLQLD